MAHPKPLHAIPEIRSTMLFAGVWQLLLKVAIPECLCRGEGSGPYGPTGPHGPVPMPLPSGQTPRPVIPSYFLKLLEMTQSKLLPLISAFKL